MESVSNLLSNDFKELLIMKEITKTELIERTSLIFEKLLVLFEK